MVSIVSVSEYDHYYMDAICIEIYIYFVWVNPWCINFIHTLLSTCDEPLDISEQCSSQAFILHLEGIIKLKIMLFAQKKRHAKNTWHCMYFLFPKQFDFSCNTFFIHQKWDAHVCIRLWNRENPNNILWCVVLQFFWSN